MEPLISVIIPIYNVEKYLNECVDSIINQTYKNLEIILVDDGSPDNCDKICDEYVQKDNRIKVIHKKNRGVSAARNTGIEEATGEWISFVDSDDWIDKDFYDILVNNIEDDVDCVLFGYKIIENNKVESHVPTNDIISINNASFYRIFSLIKDSYFGLTWAKIIKRSSIGNVRFKGISIREDFCFMYECMNKIKNIKVLSYDGYNYCTHENSILHSSNVKHTRELNILAQTLRNGIKQFTVGQNNLIFQFIMKIALQDVILKDIIKNSSLSTKEKCIKLKQIFNSDYSCEIQYSSDDGRLLKTYYLFKKLLKHTH